MRVVHNKIFCGIGPVGQPLQFMTVAPNGISRALNLPTGVGFPLPH